MKLKIVLRTRISLDYVTVTVLATDTFDMGYKASRSPHKVSNLTTLLWSKVSLLNPHHLIYARFPTRISRLC
jgi:hypothetical protein